MQRWLGVLEGFYGTPYTWEQRASLVRWCAEVGATDYVLSPKDDPLLRASWRSPGDTTALSGLVELGRSVGVEVSVVISPGLDWRGTADHVPLVAKARLLRDAGVTSLGVAWDDVTRGGAELGASHAAGVATVAAAVPARWSTCPTDYAVTAPTPYLAAFAAGLPADLPIFWTGTGIVSPTLSAAQVGSLSAALARRLVFADNVPVNDGAMSGVLHLGPYPQRDPGIVQECDGLLLNLIPGMPLASRITAEAGLRWWRGEADGWRVAPELVPLARSCRSWLTDPGPDPELLDWALTDPLRLADWLAQGCRTGLSAELADELEPWLTAWEWEAFLMAFAIHAERTMDPVEAAFAIAEGWRRMRYVPQQLFGIRYALYPVTNQVGDRILPSAIGLVQGESLSDVLCRTILERILI